MSEKCPEPHAHPERCGCSPAGTEQVSSTWLAQLRAEYRQFSEECQRLRTENAGLRQHKTDYMEAAEGTRRALQTELNRLLALINTPHTDEWFEAVRLEAAHQIERWGTNHDAGKAPADWFWLLGYLGQKAMTAQMAGNEQKARHHTISSGAMLLNWFRSITGESTAMRPGIEAQPLGIDSKGGSHD